MRVIPVMDVKEGQVVRGIAGRRHEYRPWISPLANSSEPMALAEAFRNRFGFETLYLADLDALAGRPPGCALYESLKSAGFHLWVDAGLRTAQDAVPVANAGVDRLIAGLETLAGPESLRNLITEMPPSRLVFSLDLKAGVPLAASAWQEASASAIARQAVMLGVRSVLLLDLARVGVGSGTGTEDLLKELRQEFPDLVLTVGGGVRQGGDLDRLDALGADHVLVASALHDGHLTSADLRGRV